MDKRLEKFIESIHPSTKLISIGIATVMGNTVDAVLVKNLYGQEIVWGIFNVDKGKYKGNRLANNASVEGVTYKELEYE